jgi:hypothetical protein
MKYLLLPQTKRCISCIVGRLQERREARKLEGKAGKKPAPKAASKGENEIRGEKQALLPSAGPGVVAPGVPAGSKPQLIDDRKLPHPDAAPPGGVHLASRLPPGQLSVLLQVRVSRKNGCMAPPALNVLLQV